MNKTLKQLTGLRSRAFDMAASGKHGNYPYDETFNDEVEEGFSSDGTTWTAKDGTVLTIEDEPIDKETILKIKKAVGNRKKIVFDINLINESVIVNVSNHNGYEFKIDAIIQKNGVLFLETYPDKTDAHAADDPLITGNKPLTVLLSDVLQTCNGPQEILQSLEVILSKNRKR